MGFFARILSILLILGASAHTVYATDTTIVNSSGLSKLARSTTKAIVDRNARLWAEGQIKNFVITLQTVEKRRYAFSENKLLKKEILMNAKEFIQDIKNKVYDFSITKDEKTTTEKIVLSYQKEYVDSIRKYMDQYIKGDQRERGNMNFTLNSPEGDISMRLITYRITTSEDLRKIELDGKIDITINKKGDKDPMHIILDGNIKLLDQDLYVSLRDYSITGMIDGLYDIDGGIALLKELKGKTYHQSIDREMQQYMTGNRENKEEIIKITYAILDMLQDNSLLTPVAKKGDTYILGFNTDIIKKISKIVSNDTRESLDMLALDITPVVSLPMDISMKNSTITIKALTPDIRFNALFSQENSITDLKMDIESVGNSQGSKISLHRTPFAVTANMIFDTTYFIDFASTDSQTTATLKQLDKTLGKIRIDKYGTHAWTYNLSAMWDYETYDWENDKTVSQNIIVKFFGNLEREFGKFTIIPPTITEEMSKLSYYENERDKTRTQNISNIQSHIEYYKSELEGTYPKSPKNGCVSQIKANEDSFVSFDYYTDPTNLSAGSCPDGYYYRTFNNQKYITATRVEKRESANYDNSIVSITKDTYKDISSHIGKEINSLDPKDWYFVLTGESYNY